MQPSLNGFLYATSPCCNFFVLSGAFETCDIIILDGAPGIG